MRSDFGQGRVMVDVRPFALDVPRDVLAELIRARVNADRAFAADLVGDDRREAEEEIERAMEWLDQVMARGEGEPITLLVTEEEAALELARQESEGEGGLGFEPDGGGKGGPPDPFAGAHVC